MQSLADQAAGGDARVDAPQEAVARALHAINNPLFAILGLLEFQLAEAEPGTRVHDRLVLVRKSALEIQAITRELREQSRAWEGAR
jgi:signal transduction histidine kinase